MQREKQTERWTYLQENIKDVDKHRQKKRYIEKNERQRNKTERMQNYRQKKSKPEHPLSE